MVGRDLTLVDGGVANPWRRVIRVHDRADAPVAGEVVRANLPHLVTNDRDHGTILRTEDAPAVGPGQVGDVIGVVVHHQ